MAELKRPVAVVTGASGGIGRAICLTLAREGFDIIGQYRSRTADVERLQHDIEAQGARCSIVGADLAELSGVTLLVDAVDRYLASENAALQGLVNGAALMLGPSFDAATESEFDRYVAVNLRAPFFLTQQLAQRMPPGGSIVNISSAGAHFSSPGDIIYAVSKAALESMTYHAAESLARRGIRINAVVPGFTDNGHELFTVPAVREHMASHAVLGDVTEPAVVAEAVAFLLTDRASRTTGSTLDVSGGSMLGARVLSSSPRISLRSSR